ncbi:MAG: hypothetical protein ACRDCH_00620 [Metamycoplasmataceae bacterium]
MSLKRILLGLGATLLTILPIATIISCSPSKEVEKIDDEVAKFNTPTTTKKQITSEEAVLKIRNAVSTHDRRSALLEFADVPTLDPEFDFEVVSASINVEVRSTVNVIIRVFEISNRENAKNVTYKVEGFIILYSNIDIEAAKFDKQVNTKKPNLTSSEAIDMINASSPAESLSALRELTDIPDLAEGFDFSILGASLNITGNTTIDVSIMVYRTITDESKNVTLRITGFLTGITDLETEASKFDRTVITTSPTTTSEMAVNSIQSAVTATEKLIALQLFVVVPTLDPKFDFEIISAQIDNQLDTTVNVEVNVFEVADPTNSKIVIFKVTGLNSSLEMEAKKFTPVITTKPEIGSSSAVTRVLNELNSSQKITALRSFADVPTLDPDFDFEIISAEIDSKTYTTANFGIKVFEKANPSNFREVIFQVTGFTSLSRIEIQAGKFRYSQQRRFSNDTFKSLHGAQVVDLAPANEKIEAFESITFGNNVAPFLDPLPTLDDGFDFEILSADVNRSRTTSVNVIVRIFEINNQANDKIITLEVTTYRAFNALDDQVVKFITTVPTKDTNKTASEAVDTLLASTDQEGRKIALNLLANVPSLPSNFTYEVKDAQISRRDLNEIYVTITVIENPGAGQSKGDVTFPIKGFKPV